MTANPMYFQVMMSISVQIAMFGLDSQRALKRPSPRSARRSLTRAVV